MYFKKNSNYLPMFLLHLAFFYTIVTRVIKGSVVPFDSKDEYYPLLKHAAEQLRAGFLPFWDSAHMSGFAVIGDPQSLVISPFMLFGFYVYDGGMLYYDLLVYLHIYLTSLLLYWLACQYNNPKIVALFVVLLFAFGGVISARMQHTPIILGYCYFIWFFVLFSQLRYSRFGFLSFIPLALMLLHISQVAFIMTLFFIVWFLFATIIAWKNNKIIPFISNGVLSGLLALLTVAIPLYHVFSVKLDSAQDKIGYDLASSIAKLDYHSILTMLFANANGNLKGHYTGVADTTESYLYMTKFAVLLLLMPFIYRKFKDKTQWIIGFAMLFLIISSLDLTQGSSGLLFNYYYHFIPGADLFKRPSDFLFLFQFLFCLSLVFVWQNKTIDFDKSYLFAVLMLLICVVSLIFKQYGLASLYLIMAILSVYRMQSAFYALAIISVFLLVGNNAINRLNSSHNIIGIMAPNYEQQKIIDLIKSDYADNLGIPYRVDNLPNGVNLFWQNHPMNYGLYLTQGYNPLLNKNYNMYYGVTPVQLKQKRFSGLYNSYNSWLPKLLGVKYAVVSLDISSYNSVGKLLFTTENERLYEFDEPYPRIMNPKQRIDYNQFAPKEGLDKIDFSKKYLSNNSSLDSCQGDVNISKVNYTSSEISLDYQASVAGLLTFGELSNENIVAYIDSNPIDINTVNYMFRGVCVPSGKHKLTMKYPLFNSNILNNVKRKFSQWIK